MTPVVRRRILVKLPPPQALDLAFTGLRGSDDRTQGVVRFSSVRKARERVTAYYGGSVSSLSTVRVTGRERTGGTELEVTVWPWTVAQGEEIARAVIDAIQAHLRSPSS